MLICWFKGGFCVCFRYISESKVIFNFVVNCLDFCLFVLNFVNILIFVEVWKGVGIYIINIIIFIIECG